MDIAVCGSGAAYAIDRGAPRTKPPRTAEPRHPIIHQSHHNKAECSQVCPLIVGQSMHLHAPQRNLTWIHPGVAQHQQEVDVEIYSNPSPAMAKGHMKRPCYGIQSTIPNTTAKPPARVINNTLIVPSTIPTIGCIQWHRGWLDWA